MNRERLQELIRRESETFDEELHLVRTPLTATYHTALKREQTPEVHMLLISSVHAYHLLESGEPEAVSRAIRMLERVVPFQDRNPESDTYGIWPYFYEEPLSEMDRPDWNMADFHGKQLIVTLIKHEDKLPAELRAIMRDAIGHACRAIMKRNVGPHYTNIAIMGAFVTLAGGELLGNEEFQAYGLARLKRFYHFTYGIGTFSEYNSPCYTPIAIKELHSISAYSASAEAVGYADELMNLAWKMAGEHYHAGTRQWSGPHSRTYSTWLRPDERVFLEEALLDETFEFGENIRCPKEHRHLFQSLAPRSLTEPILPEEAGYQVYATLYRNETLSLGTFSKGVMWNQRRNLVAYIRDEDRTSYVQLQFLKDGADFCSAMFAGAQTERHTLFGFNLLTDNGAWHSDLDIINGRFRSRDLRIRFKIGGAREELQPAISDEGRSVRLRLGGYTLAVTLLAERSDYGSLQLAVGSGSDSENPEADGMPQETGNRALYLDYVLYAGEEREFNFHEVKEAAWLFQLGLLGEGDELPNATVDLNANYVGAWLEAGGYAIAVELPVAPGGTRERYLSNQVTLPQERTKSRS